MAKIDEKQAVPMGGGQKHMSMATGSKAKNFKRSIVQLLSYMKSYWLVITISLVFACLGTAFSILGPKILAKINEEIMKGIISTASINYTQIMEIGLFLVALYAVSAVLVFFQNFLMSGVTAKVSRKLRASIAEKIDKLPIKYFDGTSYGDVLSRVTNDVDTVSQTLNQTLSTIITSVTMIVGILGMMFSISWKLALIAIVTIPISFVLVAITVKFSQKHFVEQQRTLGLLNGQIEEVYSNHNVIKVYNGEKEAREQFGKYNKSLYTSSYRSQFISGLMMPIMMFVGNLSYVIVCIVGGIEALSNPLFIASIIAFIQYIRQFNQPISQLSSIAGTLQSTAAASERIFEFLAEREQADESEKSVTIKNFKGDVEFRNVDFGYLEDKQIIFDFNCFVRSGQKIAIVGPTGAGKTTLVNLLMRFYEVTSGDILIDGTPIKNMTREYVRSLFGMVLQETWLFDGTIRENLRFGNPDATDEEIEQACKILGVHHFIKALPNGYEMQLDEDANLSQGQMQLLTIARAMVQNSPMLILDEATSSVDTRTEALIQEAMDTLMENRTTFVIAHRLSTIKNADTILVMKDGNVIEKGSHKELMAQNGFYKDLYNSQFDKG